MRNDEDLSNIQGVASRLDTLLPQNSETTVAPYLLTEIPSISEKPPYEVVTTLEDLLATVPQKEKEEEDYEENENSQEIITSKNRKKEKWINKHRTTISHKLECECNDSEGESSYENDEYDETNTTEEMSNENNEKIHQTNESYLEKCDNSGNRNTSNDHEDYEADDSRRRRKYDIITFPQTYSELDREDHDTNNIYFPYNLKEILSKKPVNNKQNELHELEEMQTQKNWLHATKADFRCNKFQTVVRSKTTRKSKKIIEPPTQTDSDYYVDIDLPNESVVRHKFSDLLDEMKKPFNDYFSNNHKRMRRKGSDRQIWKEFKWPEHRKYTNSQQRSSEKPQKDIDDLTEQEIKKTGLESTTRRKSANRQIWKEFKWPERKKIVGSLTSTEKDMSEENTKHFGSTGKVNDTDGNKKEKQLSLTMPQKDIDNLTEKETISLTGLESTTRRKSGGRQIWKEFKWPERKKIIATSTKIWPDFPVLGTEIPSKDGMEDYYTEIEASVDEWSTRSEVPEKNYMNTEDIQFYANYPKKHKILFPEETSRILVPMEEFEDLEQSTKLFNKDIEKPENKAEFKNSDFFTESTFSSSQESPHVMKTVLWDKLHLPYPKTHMKVISSSTSSGDELLTFGVLDRSTTEMMGIWNRFKWPDRIKSTSESLSKNKENKEREKGIWTKFNWPSHNKYLEGGTTSKVSTTAVSSRMKSPEESLIDQGIADGKDYTTKIIEKYLKSEELSDSNLEVGESKTTIDEWESFQWPPSRTVPDDLELESLKNSETISTWSPYGSIKSDVESEYDRLEKPEKSQDMLNLHSHEKNTNYTNGTNIEMSIPPFPPPEEYDDYILQSTPSAEGDATFREFHLSPLFNEEPNQEFTLESDHKGPFWGDTNTNTHRHRTSSEEFPTKATSPSTRSTILGDLLEMGDDMSFSEHEAITETKQHGPVKVSLEHTIHPPVRESEDDDNLWDFRILSEDEVVTFHPKTRKPTQKKTTIYSFKPIGTTADDWEIFNDLPKQEQTKHPTESTITDGEKTTFYVLLTRPAENMEYPEIEEETESLEPPSLLASPGAVESSTDYYDEEERIVPSKDYEFATETSAITTETKTETSKIENVTYSSFGMEKVKTVTNESPIEDNFNKQNDKEGLVDSLELETATFGKLKPVRIEDYTSVKFHSPLVEYFTDAIPQMTQDNLLSEMTEISDMLLDVGKGTTKLIQGDKIFTESYDHRSMSLPFNENLDGALDITDEINKPDNSYDTLPLPPMSDLAEDFLKEQSEMGLIRDPYSVVYRPLDLIGQKKAEEEKIWPHMADKLSFTEENLEDNFATALVEPEHLEAGGSTGDSWEKTKYLLETLEGPSVLDKLKKKFTNIRAKPITAGGGSENDGKRGKEFYLEEGKTGLNDLLRTNLTYPEAVEAVIAVERTTNIFGADEDFLENGIKYPEAVEAVVAYEPTAESTLSDVTVSKYVMHTTELSGETTKSHQNIDDKLENILEMESQLEKTESNETSIGEVKPVLDLLEPIPEISHELENTSEKSFYSNISFQQTTYHEINGSTLSEAETEVTSPFDEIVTSFLATENSISLENIGAETKATTTMETSASASGGLSDIQGEIITTTEEFESFTTSVGEKHPIQSTVGSIKFDDHKKITGGPEETSEIHEEELLTPILTNGEEQVSVFTSQSNSLHTSEITSKPTVSEKLDSASILFDKKGKSSVTPSIITDYSTIEFKHSLRTTTEKYSETKVLPNKKPMREEEQEIDSNLAHLPEDRHETSTICKICNETEPFGSSENISEGNPHENHEEDEKGKTIRHHTTPMEYEGTESVSKITQISEMQEVPTESTNLSTIEELEELDSNLYHLSREYQHETSTICEICTEQEDSFPYSLPIGTTRANYTTEKDLTTTVEIENTPIIMRTELIEEELDANLHHLPDHHIGLHETSTICEICEEEEEDSIKRTSESLIHVERLHSSTEYNAQETKGYGFEGKEIHQPLPTTSNNIFRKGNYLTTFTTHSISGPENLSTEGKTEREGEYAIEELKSTETIEEGNVFTPEDNSVTSSVESIDKSLIAAKNIEEKLMEITETEEIMTKTGTMLSHEKSTEGYLKIETTGESGPPILKNQFTASFEATETNFYTEFITTGETEISSEIGKTDQDHSTIHNLDELTKGMRVESDMSTEYKGVTSQASSESTSLKTKDVIPKGEQTHKEETEVKIKDAEEREITTIETEVSSLLENLEDIQEELFISTLHGKGTIEVTTNQHISEVSIGHKTSEKPELTEIEEVAEISTYLSYSTVSSTFVSHESNMPEESEISKESTVRHVSLSEPYISENIENTLEKLNEVVDEFIVTTPQAISENEIEENLNLENKLENLKHEFEELLQTTLSTEDLLENSKLLSHAIKELITSTEKSTNNTLSTSSLKENIGTTVDEHIIISSEEEKSSSPGTTEFPIKVSMNRSSSEEIEAVTEIRAEESTPNSEFTSIEESLMTFSESSTNGELHHGSEVSGNLYPTGRISSSSSRLKQTENESEEAITDFYTEVNIASNSILETKIDENDISKPSTESNTSTDQILPEGIKEKLNNLDELMQNLVTTPLTVKAHSEGIPGFEAENAAISVVEKELKELNDEFEKMLKTTLSPEVLLDHLKSAGITEQTLSSQKEQSDKLHKGGSSTIISQYTPDESHSVPTNLPTEYSKEELKASTDINGEEILVSTELENHSGSFSSDELERKWQELNKIVSEILTTSQPSKEHSASLVELEGEITENKLLQKELNEFEEILESTASDEEILGLEKSISSTLIPSSTTIETAGQAVSSTSIENLADHIITHEGHAGKPKLHTEVEQKVTYSGQPTEKTEPIVHSTAVENIAAVTLPEGNPDEILSKKLNGKFNKLDEVVQKMFSTSISSEELLEGATNPEEENTESEILEKELKELNEKLEEELQTTIAAEKMLEYLGEKLHSTSQHVAEETEILTAYRTSFTTSFEEVGTGHNLTSSVSTEGNSMGSVDQTEIHAELTSQSVPFSTGQNESKQRFTESTEGKTEISVSSARDGEIQGSTYLATVNTETQHEDLSNLTSLFEENMTKTHSTIEIISEITSGEEQKTNFHTSGNTMEPMIHTFEPVTNILQEKFGQLDRIVNEFLTSTPISETLSEGVEGAELESTEEEVLEKQLEDLEKEFQVMLNTTISPDYLLEAVEEILASTSSNENEEDIGRTHSETSQGFTIPNESKSSSTHPEEKASSPIIEIEKTVVETKTGDIDQRSEEVTETTAEVPRKDESEEEEIESNLLHLPEHNETSTICQICSEEEENVTHIPSFTKMVTTISPAHAFNFSKSPGESDKAHETRTGNYNRSTSETAQYSSMKVKASTHSTEHTSAEDTIFRLSTGEDGKLLESISNNSELETTSGTVSNISEHETTSGTVSNISELETTSGLVSNISELETTSGRLEFDTKNQETVYTKTEEYSSNTSEQNEKAPETSSFKTHTTEGLSSLSLLTTLLLSLVTSTTQSPEKNNTGVSHFSSNISGPQNIPKCLVVFITGESPLLPMNGTKWVPSECPRLGGESTTAHPIDQKTTAFVSTGTGELSTIIESTVTEPTPNETLSSTTELITTTLIPVEQLPEIISNNFVEDGCSEADFENNNKCFCMLDLTIEGLEGSNSSKTFTAKCSKFLKVNQGLVMRNETPAALKRSRRSYLYLKYLNRQKRELVEYNKIDEVLANELTATSIDTTIYTAVGGNATIPCFYKDEVVERENFMKYVWTAEGDKAINFSDRIREATDGDLKISEVAVQDGGNYTCSMNRPFGNTDTEHKRFVHELLVISKPIFKVKTTIMYESDEPCSLKDGDIVHAYLPKLLEDLLCGIHKRVCKVEMERPSCMEVENKTYLTVKYVVSLESISYLIPSIADSDCDFNCQMKLMGSLVSLLIKNVETSSVLDVLSEIPSFNHTFKPREVIFPTDRSAVEDLTLLPKLVIGCPAGFGIQKTTSKICVACPPNTYNSENSSTCSSCPRDHYQTKIGSTSCIECKTPFDDKMCVGMMFENKAFFILYVGSSVAIVFCILLCIFCAQNSSQPSFGSPQRRKKAQTTKRRRIGRKDVEDPAEKPLLPKDPSIPKIVRGPRLPPPDF